MEASRTFRNACFTSLYLLGLVNIAACDSVAVDSNSDPVDDAPQYTGALHPAALNRDNATRLVARILGAKRAVITGGETRSRSAPYNAESLANPGLAQILGQLSESIRISVAPALVSAEVQGKSRARAQANRTIACDIGSIGITGNLQDDDSGSIKLEFRHCYFGNTVIDGKINLLIRRFNQQQQIITDYNYRFKSLLWSAPGLSLRLDGAIDALFDVNSKTEQLTINRFLTINNFSNEMVMLVNTVSTQQLESLAGTSPSIEAHYGRLFDSVYGYVDFVTTSPLLYIPAMSPFPVGGQVLVRGGSSSIRVTIMPFQRVRLELDLGDNSSVEIVTVLDWVSILNGIELLDSDGDGMHDRWELVHGLDPLDDRDALQDADNDGYSNVTEYLAGSNPNLAISMPG